MNIQDDIERSWEGVSEFLKEWGQDGDFAHRLAYTFGVLGRTIKIRVILHENKTSLTTSMNLFPSPEEWTNFDGVLGYQDFSLYREIITIYIMQLIMLE